MSLNATRALLLLAILLLLAFCVAVLIWGITPPQLKADPAEKSVDDSLALIRKGELHDAVRNVPDSLTLWDRPLRSALYDPPPLPPEPEIAAPPPTPIQAKLWATMIDRNDSKKSIAVIRLNTGEEVFRYIGQTLGGVDSDAELLEINAGSIKVRRGMEQQEIYVEYVQK